VLVWIYGGDGDGGVNDASQAVRMQGMMSHRPTNKSLPVGSNLPLQSVACVFETSSPPDTMYMQANLSDSGIQANAFEKNGCETLQS
jgi:hypothetical protein